MHFTLGATSVATSNTTSLLAPKIECTFGWGQRSQCAYGSFRSKEGVKPGLDSVIVLFILAVTVNYVNRSVMQPLVACDKNGLELFGVLRNMTWRSVSMLQAPHVHLKLPHLHIFVHFWNVQLEMRAFIDWSIVLPCNEV